LKVSKSVSQNKTKAIFAIVSQIEQARATDKLLKKPSIEGGFIRKKK